MRKILNHKDFISLRDLSEPIGESLLESYYTDYAEIDISEKKALDSLMNNLSKSLLGGLSRINLIDNIRKGDLDIKKEIITKKYELRDELDALEIKRNKARSAGSREALIQIENEIDKKKKEYSAFVKMKNAQMRKGADLMHKVIDGNDRRKEYYETGLADDEYELSKFEYEMARKSSEDSDEIKKLKAKFDEASKKADELISRISARKSASSSIKDSDLSDIGELKKIVGNRDAGVLMDLRDKTAERSEALKEELVDLLNSIKKEISMKNGGSKRKINSALRKSTSIANEIDALENLYTLYSSVGRGKKSIDKKLSNTTSLTDIFSKINLAVTDGKDAQSGLTKEIIDLSNNPTDSKIKSLTKKLS
jgi:hypothetical protein